jgi:hypothetical protein
MVFSQPVQNTAGIVDSLTSLDNDLTRCGHVGMDGRDLRVGPPVAQGKACD